MNLGKNQPYKDIYDSSLLIPISRKSTRENLPTLVGLFGHDLWNAYEISWLSPGGKPKVAIAKFTFDCNSENIIESKSMKMYLNSFNMTEFLDRSHVEKTIAKDLSEYSQSNVLVQISDLYSYNYKSLNLPIGDCIDGSSLEIEKYGKPSAEILTADDYVVVETLYSNIFRSACPVTNQPDWATLTIRYEGKKIDRASLLSYIVAFRKHQAFHEQCVERVFVDLLNIIEPKRLAVVGNYTRRGGIDINPCRSTEMECIFSTRDPRQ